MNLTQFIVKWEYRRVHRPDLNFMNALGGDGWELVCIEPEGEIYFFKRPLIPTDKDE